MFSMSVYFIPVAFVNSVLPISNHG